MVGLQACEIPDLQQDAGECQSFSYNLLMDNPTWGWCELLCLAILSPPLETEAPSVGMTVLSPNVLDSIIHMYNSLYMLYIYNGHLYCFYTGTQSKANELL